MVRSLARTALALAVTTARRRGVRAHPSPRSWLVVGALLCASTARADSIAGRFGGPVGEVSLGYFVPLPDDLDDENDVSYHEHVAGGPHLAFRLGWLVPVLTRPDRRLLLGPVVEAAYTRYGDFAADDGLDAVTRWRWTGGARIALATSSGTVGLEGQVGVDRPSYDFSGVIERLCGDPTTSGPAWEVTALGHHTLGHFVIGGGFGVLHGDHRDDQPACTGVIRLDTLDYVSVDVMAHVTLGARF